MADTATLTAGKCGCKDVMNTRNWPGKLHIAAKTANDVARPVVLELLVVCSAVSNGVVLDDGFFFPVKARPV